MINVKQFGATGDGSTDDRLAIQAALDAAASSGGEEVFFPPGTYIVSRSGTSSWSLDLPGSNITLTGVMGASWLKHPSGMPNASVALLRVDQKSNVVIRDLGFDGNWGNAATKITSASAGSELQQSTINVESTAGFPSSGYFWLSLGGAAAQQITYTAKTATTFTGCSGGSGTMSLGDRVGYVDANTGINHTTQANDLTTIAAGSNGQALPQSTINVASTTGFASSGSLTVVTSLGPQSVTYTGTTSTTFTGCSGGIGTMSTGNEVAAEIDAQNYLVMVRGSTNVSIESALFRQSYGDCIWIGTASSDFTLGASRITIRNCELEMSARNGISLAQKCGQIQVENCRATNIYAQAFDSEPIGIAQPVRDVSVQHCELAGWWNRGNTARTVNSPLSIIGGYPTGSSEANLARMFRVRDCTIHGSVIIHSAVDVVFANNRVICDWAGYSYAPIYVDHVVDDIWITDNYVYDRTTAAPSGPLTHEASISVHWYGVGSTNYQPSGVHVIGNRVHARNGRHGIKIEGTGGVAGDTGTASITPSGTTLTDSSKSWTDDQWIGHTVVRGAVSGTIVDNNATSVTISEWLTPLGESANTPAVGTYVIVPRGGYVDVKRNSIDCSNDGSGGGGHGIFLYAARAGMRIRCCDNEIHNANTDGMHVKSTDAARAYVSLEIDDNTAWDDQTTPTCTAAVRFASPFHVTKLILDPNSTGTGVSSAIAGLASGQWRSSDSLPARWNGYGSPESVVTAAVGATYLRLDGGSGTTLYVKESGSGNTGWAAK